MNFKIYLSVIFYSIFLFINISAQTINVNGKLSSQPNNIPLPNAIITFYDAADTTNNLGSVTSDANGLFSSILTDVEDVKNTNVSSKLNVSFSGKSNNIISFEISNSKNEKITANIYSLSTGQLINSFDVNKNNFNWDLKNNHDRFPKKIRECYSHLLSHIYYLINLASKNAQRVRDFPKGIPLEEPVISTLYCFLFISRV